MTKRTISILVLAAGILSLATDLRVLASDSAAVPDAPQKAASTLYLESVYSGLANQAGRISDQVNRGGYSALFDGSAARPALVRAGGWDSLHALKSLDRGTFKSSASGATTLPPTPDQQPPSKTTAPVDYGQDYFMFGGALFGATALGLVGMMFGPIGLIVGLLVGAVTGALSTYYANNDIGPVTGLVLPGASAASPSSSDSSTSSPSPSTPATAPSSDSAPTAPSINTSAVGSS